MKKTNSTVGFLGALIATLSTHIGFDGFLYLLLPEATSFPSYSRRDTKEGSTRTGVKKVTKEAEQGRCQLCRT